MPISEAARSDLYTGLAEVLGPQRAETLMSALPIYDPYEVATKSDIQSLRAEISELRAEFKGDFVKLSLVLIAGFLGVIATLIGVGLTS